MQVKSLMDGGVDILRIETTSDMQSAKAAIFAVNKFFERSGTPRSSLMINATSVDQTGRTPSGQTTETFCVSISHTKPLTVGCNCALGACRS